LSLLKKLFFMFNSLYSQIIPFLDTSVDFCNWVFLSEENFKNYMLEKKIYNIMNFYKARENDVISFYTIYNNIHKANLIMDQINNVFLNIDIEIEGKIKSLDKMSPVLNCMDEIVESNHRLKQLDPKFVGEKLTFIREEMYPTLDNITGSFGKKHRPLMEITPHLSRKSSLWINFEYNEQIHLSDNLSLSPLEV